MGTSPARASRRRTVRLIAGVVAAFLMVALLWAFLLRREVRRRTTALRVSEARYVHLFNAAADLVFVLDIPRGGAFTAANHATQRAFGVDEAGLRAGSPLLLAAVADAPAAVEAHLVEAARTGGATTVLDLRCADGRVVPYEVATRRLDTSAGTAHVAVARDVHDRRLYENGLVEAMETAEAARAEAERARSAAEAADRFKGTIFTNLSHELRTPLTAILGYADILCEEAEDDMLEHAEIIRDSGNRLLRTLTDVLDLARLDRLALPGADAAHERARAARRRRDRPQADRRSTPPAAAAKGLALRFGSDAQALAIVARAGRARGASRRSSSTTLSSSPSAARSGCRCTARPTISRSACRTRASACPRRFSPRPSSRSGRSPTATTGLSRARASG